MYVEASYGVVYVTYVIRAVWTECGRIVEVSKNKRSEGTYVWYGALFYVRQRVSGDGDFELRLENPVWSLVCSNGVF
jgi:hypothetical protein